MILPQGTRVFKNSNYMNKLNYKHNKKLYLHRLDKKKNTYCTFKKILCNYAG